MLDRVEGALPALGWIERLPGGVLDGHWTATASRAASATGSTWPTFRT
jgi:hypothetical protein